MEFSREILEKLYTAMLTIRLTQEKIAEIYPQVPRRIQCPVHLYTGHEAIAAGVCLNLSPADYVFSYYRSHGHYLAMGGSVKALFAELYGKKTGCSKGRGGSMHLIDVKNGFMGASAIVAGSIPLAVGAALAFKMRNEKKVAVVFFGDAACEEGIWHESMNFASLKRLPIIFICENNFYAVKTHISQRQAEDNIYRRAANYGMPGLRVDGNDALEVFPAAYGAFGRARKGGGPTLIEARTYRWLGHVENTFFNKDILEGRPKDEVESWMKRCPVKKMEEQILSRGILEKDDLKRIGLRIEEEIKEAILFAEESPFPEVCDEKAEV